MTNYIVMTGDGTALCDGVSEYEIERVAQAWADRLAETVYYTESGTDSDDEDIVTAVEPRTVRCECGEVATVRLGRASQCDECFQLDARAALADAGYGQICARLIRHGHGLRSLCLTPYGEEHDHDH